MKLDVKEMNINLALECESCNTAIYCRLGMSNRAYQPLRFVCPECSAPIDITLTLGTPESLGGLDITGAKNNSDKWSFSPDKNFVDLHLDFPTSFEKYVPGMTPFMKASMRCGRKQMAIHNMRLNMLNSRVGMIPNIKAAIKLYGKGKVDLYKKVVQELFDEEDIDLEKTIDQNKLLYLILEQCFAPFNDLESNYNTVHGYTDLLLGFIKDNKLELERFVNEIVENGFLKNLQIDCLEIYPKMLDAELIFRPAFFLDYDKTYQGSMTAYRVSSHDFEEFKDLYKDISEILARQLTLVAGINNLLKRNDHNKFTDIRGNPKDLNDFADRPFGLKLGLIDDSWYQIDSEIADNQLRNSIAHYKAEYDEITQLLNYFPKKEGMKQEKSEQMYFLDFCRKILLSFREMHKLNHLIKCLYVYYYLHMESGKK